MLNQNQRLRIACYGYAEPDAGSVSSAGHVVLEELLRRGHQIDFFGKPSFAFPRGLDAWPNFRYVHVEGHVEHVLGFVATRAPRIIRFPAGLLTADQTARNIRKAITAEHHRQAYNSCVYLGTWAFGRTMGLPTISWIQGPPGTDSRSISKHAFHIRRYEGVARYMALRIFSAYRETFGKPNMAHSDVAICGSRWAADDLQRSLSKDVRMTTLPYPIDLKQFSPDEDKALPSSKSRPTVLWAGRAVPRKRLDLFLAACEKLIAGGRDIQVQVVGGFGFAPGYRQLIDQFKFPQHLRYQPAIGRERMAQLFNEAAVLVQPSECENFGSSVAEALACGTPVVVGPTNGTLDYIGDGGVIFKDYEPASVAAAIAEVLDGVQQDPAGWAQRCRSAAEAGFDVNRIVDRLELILQTASKSSKNFGVNVNASEFFESNRASTI